MTAAAAKMTEPRPSPLELLIARAEARAILVTNYQMTLQDAVDGLQQSAVACGLVDQIGQDAVQSVLAKAFKRC